LKIQLWRRVAELMWDHHGFETAMPPDIEIWLDTEDFTEAD